ncbi:MAG: DUF6029 family protein [Spirosomaceae bacterium]|jgi:hypothetical protein|nr:DUF6029 family protein [Spirosomataceae bacterium]
MKKIAIKGKIQIFLGQIKHKFEQKVAIQELIPNNQLPLNLLSKYIYYFSFFGLVFIFFNNPPKTFAQAPTSTDSSKGTLSGSIQIDYQKYFDDKSFIYQSLEKKYGLNTYANLFYQKKGFSAGARFEGYFPPLLAYPQNLNGYGLANRFLNYRKKSIDFTVGNFYEQFGNGLLFRSQEQRFLGMDTSTDGINLKVNPSQNYQFKILGGKQRLGFKHAAGWLLGIDNQLNISHLTATQADFLVIGLSYLLKKESYDGILKTINPSVMGLAGRLNYQQNRFGINLEYVFKSSDASPINRYVINNGSGVFISSNLDFEKLSVNLQLKRIDNMDFRSQRTESLNNALINYIPATTKQHTHRLLTLYPYASQVLGEIGGQVEFVYSIDKNSVLTLNLANLNGLNKVFLSENQYKTKALDFGEIYYQDFNIELERKWNKSFKSNILFIWMNFNKGQILGGFPEMVKSYTLAFDGTYKFNNKRSMRFEIQHLATKQDKGNWAYGLVEYSIAPKYFLFLSDEWNYGQSRHYANIGTAFSHKKGRLSLSYGNQREGLLCVGGICRIVPAYKGFSLSTTASF